MTKLFCFSCCLFVYIVNLNDLPGLGAIFGGAGLLAILYFPVTICVSIKLITNSYQNVSKFRTVRRVKSN